MSHQIMSRAMMFERGERAFAEGRPRVDHRMNWHAPGLADWRAGWDHAAALCPKVSRPVRADGRPQLHVIGSAEVGFDARQVGGV